MQYRALAALALLGSACTANNPFWSGGGDGGNSDGGSRDLSSAGHDLRGGGDLAPMCHDGDRQCIASTQASASLVCTAGMYKADRVCPFMAACDQGYCTPPPPNGVGAGNSCSSENDCSQISTEMSCEPFVDPLLMDVSWFCAHR